MIGMINSIVSILIIILTRVRSLVRGEGDNKKKDRQRRKDKK